MSDRYPYPVEPATYESLWGYTHRLANENLLDRHVWLRQDVGVAGNTAELGEAQLGKLAELSGVRVDTLRRMQHGDSDMLNAKFFGNEIRRRRLEFVRSRICPLCFGEVGYHNRIFDLRILRACPIHKIELVEFCPTCSTGLSWHRNAIPRCSHGDTLWSGTEFAFEPRSVERPLRAERLIFERCRQPVGDESILAALPSPVRSLTLEDQLVLVALLGDPTVTSADLARFEEQYVFIRRAAKDRKAACIIKFGHYLRKVGILPVACVSGSADSALYRVADIKMMPNKAA